MVSSHSPILWEGCGSLLIGSFGFVDFFAAIEEEATVVTIPTRGVDLVFVDKVLPPGPLPAVGVEAFAIMPTPMFLYTGDGEDSFDDDFGGVVSVTIAPVLVGLQYLRDVGEEFLALLFVQFHVLI
jgi:hypothetical protein